MLTSAPAGRHVRLVPTTASRLAHAALPDRDQAGVGLDQALRAEPGRLERDPNIQAGAIHTLDHPLLHGHPPLVGAPDGASAPHGRRHSPAGAAAFARSPRTTRTPVWQLCTGDHGRLARACPQLSQTTAAARWMAPRKWTARLS